MCKGATHGKEDGNGLGAVGLDGVGFHPRVADGVVFVGVVFQVLLLLVDIPFVQVADPVLLQDLQHHLRLVLRVDVPESAIFESLSL